MSVRIIIGDALVELRKLPEESVHCCVTSPPYFGLRDYGVAGQIGLEPSPDEYVEALVDVFREVKRVLRSDGTFFLNLGDAYSSGVADVPDLLASRLKGDVFFFGCADPRRRSAERIHVLIYDKAAPNPVFKPLLRAQRVVVKQGQHDLCQIGSALNAPVDCWVGGALRLGIPHAADAQRFINLPENIGVVVTAGDLGANPSLRDAIALTVENRQAPLAVKISGEPVAEWVVANVTVWDTVTLNAGSVSVPNINPVNETVALFNGVDLGPRGNGDLAVRSATDEHISLNLKGGGDLRFQTVSQLFLLRDGVTPYRKELANAIKWRNANSRKQELGVPEMVKRALMEGGWICRQTLIWSKPNPMPESVTDRCTKAHEYLFLLSKSERYFYDAEAIAEAAEGTAFSRAQREAASGRVYSSGRGHMDRNDAGKSCISGSGEYRNKRSVWTVTSAPFPEAHFATFPPALIEPCIKAGCPEGGTVLDPFGGAGTTGLVADRLRRDAILIELNPQYAEIARKRIETDAGMLFGTPVSLSRYVPPGMPEPGEAA